MRCAPRRGRRARRRRAARGSGHAPASIPYLAHRFAGRGPGGPVAAGHCDGRLHRRRRLPAISGPPDDRVSPGVIIAPPASTTPPKPDLSNDLGSRRDRRKPSRYVPCRRGAGRESPCPERGPPTRHDPHGRGGSGAVRGPARLAADRRRRARAEEDRAQLLHDQLGGPRGQRDRWRTAAHRRPGVPSLPVRWLRHGPIAPARGQHADARHAARDRRVERGPDCPGPPQGLGQPGAVDPAADEHDRQPPAEGDGPRLQPGSREAHRGRDRPARGRRRRLLVRGREREPRHCPRCDQHGALRRAHGIADAAAARLRGQRHRHQRADAGGLDRVHVRRDAASALHRGGR